MKKLIALFLLLACLTGMLAACGNTDNDTGTGTGTAPQVPEEEQTTIRIGVLSGPTGMGMAKLWADSNAGTAEGSYQFTLYDAPQNALNDFIAGELDIVATPTNTAATRYNAKQDVQILAVNTLGTLYLMEKGETVSSIADLRGKTVAISAPGSTTDLIFRYLLTENGLDPESDVTILTAPDHDTLVGWARMGKTSDNETFDVVMLPEPKVSQLLLTEEGADYRVCLDLNDAWAAVAPADTSIAMGCVMTTTAFAQAHQDAIELFLSEYSASISYIADPDNLQSAAQMIVDAGIIPKAPMAIKALPGSAIAFLSGDDMKTALEAFYSALCEQNPQVIGGALPSDAFYYGAGGN